ncbi:hypothetical protein V8C86DRAFT_3107348 [Haematococcus lacustris]
MEVVLAEGVVLRAKNVELQAQLQEQSVELQAANQAVRDAQLQKIKAVQAAEVKMSEAGRQKAFHEAELQGIEVTL